MRIRRGIRDSRSRLPPPSHRHLLRLPESSLKGAALTSTELKLSLDRHRGAKAYARRVQQTRSRFSDHAVQTPTQALAGLSWGDGEVMGLSKRPGAGRIFGEPQRKDLSHNTPDMRRRRTPVRKYALTAAFPLGAHVAWRVRTRRPAGRGHVPDLSAGGRQPERAAPGLHSAPAGRQTTERLRAWGRCLPGQLRSVPPKPPAGRLETAGREWLPLCNP